MFAKNWEKILAKDGYIKVHKQHDGAGVHYPPHTHETKTAHVIIEGEMTLISDAKSEVYHPGDRIDVPASTFHEATMGPAGCVYLVGE